MSESPEMAATPPAVKRLLTVRKELVGQRQMERNSLDHHLKQAEYREDVVARMTAEIADIDRAIAALSYPDAGVST